MKRRLIIMSFLSILGGYSHYQYYEHSRPTKAPQVAANTRPPAQMTTSHPVAGAENNVRLHLPIKQRTAYFGEPIKGSVQTTFKQPTLITTKQAGQSTLQLQVPYQVAIQPTPVKDLQPVHRNVDHLIRVTAGGRTWAAQAGENWELTAENPTAQGTVLINMLIDDTHPEVVLRNYKLQMYEPTHADWTALFTIKHRQMTI